jgi:hypothetical protein
MTTAAISIETAAGQGFWFGDALKDRGETMRLSLAMPRRHMRAFNIRGARSGRIGAICLAIARHRT